MDYENQITCAIKQNNPVDCLIKIAEDMRDSGMNREKVTETFMDVLRQQVNESPEADYIRDVLDFITGFCSPHVQIPYGA